jgi:signal transduction histidine kinase
MTNPAAAVGTSPEPRGRLFRKYSTILASLVAGALVISGTVETFFSYADHRDALARIQAEKASGAAAAITQFVKELEGHIGWTTQFASLPGVSPLDQRHYDFIRLMRQAPAITELSYLDENGRQQLRISRIDPDVIGPGPDFHSDPKFTEAKARQLWHSGVRFLNDSEPYMTIAVAGSGRTAGVTAAEVNLKFVWDVVSKIVVGKTGHAYVVDSEGRLIAYPDISLVLRETNVSQLPQVRSALSLGSIPQESVGTDPEGRSVLTANASIQELGWFVFVDLPIAEAFQPIYTSIYRTVGLVLGGIILAALAGLLLARRMTVPIRLLQHGASRIGGGDLGRRIEVRTGDELETLAGQFNRMAEQLEESYGSLEQKVTDRTRELREALDRIQALAEIVRTVNSSLDLQMVLGRILAHACSLADSGGGAIYVFEVGSGSFELAATHGMDEELVQAISAIPIRLGETIVGRCAADRDVVQISDIEQEPQYPLRAALMRAGIRALLGVPLMRDDQVTGALIVRRKRPGLFDAPTVDLLKSFAAQSALALYNARLFRELEHKSRQLEMASQHKSQFLANMSHELRTPMNAILGFTELVHGGIYGEPPPRIRTVLGRVIANGKHLLGLINDVLDLSKIEAGQLRLNLADYSLVDVVRSVASSVEPLAADKKLVLRLNVPPDLPRGRGDAQRIAQVLLNLVGNAVKFTEQGEVVIDVTLAVGEFLVVVTDTGPGIPEAEQKQIFEEFHQVDSSSTRAKGGTGLGLAIAKRIVEMHHGRIWVESEPGRGSRFCCALAVRVGEASAAA